MRIAFGLVASSTFRRKLSSLESSKDQSSRGGW
jgi:hypothetical protein